MEQAIREEALQRLRSVEGHIRGIERMLEDDAGCLELIRQTLAVKRALERVGQLMVSSHLRCCIAAEVASDAPGERQRAVDELLEVLDLSGRL